MVYSDLDLRKAAIKALDAQYGNSFNIAYENIPFTAPANGGDWLKFDYVPAPTIYQSLDRKCKSLIGMVQVGVVFAPDTGMERPMRVAADIANFFEDGKILSVGSVPDIYVSVGAELHPVQKSERGWFIPVRFYVRYDGK